MKTYVVGQIPSGYAPLPPENVLINGARYPADISGQYTISWAPNPREHMYGSAVSGNETYTLRLYGESDTLVRTVTGITGNSYTWSTEAVDSELILGETYSEDTFDTDSTGSYTQYAATNASWAISGGELVGTGGNHASFIRNGTSYSDVAIEADINYIHDGGLTLRFVDNSNYYALFLSDDSGANPTSNLRLFKRVSGAFTQIGSSVNFAWTRGTSKTVRFRASGTTLTAYVDGVSVLSTTDASITGPGSVGVRCTDQ